MISRAAEYALRTMVCLAASADRPETARALAKATGIPESFQMKVLQVLRRAGFVHSRRGLGGGFVMARHARSISVQAVIDAVDGSGPVESPGMNGSHPLRDLQRRLRDGAGLMQMLFESITVAELCGEEAVPSKYASPLAAIQAHQPQRLR